MGVEIERKFLVTSSKFREDAVDDFLLRQGYLYDNPDKTVRIRMLNDTGAWIAVKGRNQGSYRAEYEYRIPEQDGEEMLQMCDSVLEKRRYIVPTRDFKIEVDVFGGDNRELIVAEVEFEPDDTRQLMDSIKFRETYMPEWIGSEVTNDPRFYNSNLIKRPYNTWR